MNKYSNEYEKTKDDILQKNVRPFIAAIDNSLYQSSKREIIEETMRCFQIARSSIISGDGSGFLDNIAEAAMPADMKSRLLADKRLKEAYIQLGKFYIDTTDTKTSTIVRELLLDVINPFPEFTPIHSQLPQILAQDSRTKKNFVEATNNLNPYQNTEQEVYYAVSKPILITRSRGIFDSGEDYDICLRDKITKEELNQAIKYKKDELVKLFKSPHDAIEYAQSLQKGGHIGDKGEGTIPAVMMVSRKKNDVSTLEFEDQLLKIHAGTSSSDYSGNGRVVWISSATVLADKIVPLAAMCLYERCDFGRYRVFNTQMRLNPGPMNPKTLQERVDVSLGALIDKASDLLNRGFKTEADKLLAFKNSLEKDLLILKDQPQPECGDYLQKLRVLMTGSNTAFETIKKELNHSRNSNHLIAEAFLSVCTLGLYAIAMFANKVITNKFSFFSTDTASKLDDSQRVVNDYLNAASRIEI